MIFFAFLFIAVSLVVSISANEVLESLVSGITYCSNYCVWSKTLNSAHLLMPMIGQGLCLIILMDSMVVCNETKQFNCRSHIEQLASVHSAVDQQSSAAVTTLSSSNSNSIGMRTVHC